MRKALIISPYFPPSNAADMQRIRMSLPYFKSFGWQVEVVTVDPSQSHVAKDEILLQTVPEDILIHQVKAFPVRWTSKLGLGSLALRSLWYYKRKVNRLLQKTRFDLIYFSTTQFPVCALGPYWKKKFGIPYVIDMQDPWHSEYYKNKPQKERPPKYWFSYRLNKWLEPIAMKDCAGLISVSQKYIDDLQLRYPVLATRPASVITFGASLIDQEIAATPGKGSTYLPEGGNKNLVYVGVGGSVMNKSLRIIFRLFKRGLQQDAALFSQFHLYFLGTSYAPSGRAVLSMKPVAEEEGVTNYVTEQTGRLPYFTSLSVLKQASGLVVPGTDDAGYSASKIYNYMLAGRPLFCLFHPSSNIHDVIKSCRAGYAMNFDHTEDELYQAFRAYLCDCVNRSWTSALDIDKFNQFTAETMTKRQVDVFNQVTRFE